MGKIPHTAKAIVVSVNPKSGASDQQAIAHRLGGLLTDRGFDVHIPTELEMVFSKAREYHESGQLRAVIAAGGDGTASMLVNELPKSCPICILPLGTENLLAKYLELTAEPDELCELICEGNFVDLDVGKANERLFLVMCGCGFDADVVQRLHTARKGNISHWSYAKPIFNAISRYRYPTLRIQLDGSKKMIKSKWAFVFNVPRYAMNLPIVDDADSMDGKLDLCTFRGGNLIRGLIYLAGIVLRQHRRWQDINYAQFQKLTIVSDEPVPYQLDGDPGGELPLTVEVVPRYMRMVVGERWLRKNAADSLMKAKAT